jgi:hypothetical protein
MSIRHAEDFFRIPILRRARVGNEPRRICDVVVASAQLGDPYDKRLEPWILILEEQLSLDFTRAVKTDGSGWAHEHQHANLAGAGIESGSERFHRVVEYFKTLRLSGVRTSSESGTESNDQKSSSFHVDLTCHDVNCAYMVNMSDTIQIAAAVKTTAWDTFTDSPIGRGVPPTHARRAK